MRLGFFAGIDGDHDALQGVLELLGDCDVLVSLGNLVGEPGPDDGRVLRDAAALVREGRLVVLAGPGEKARGRDATLPAEVRALLREASPAKVVEGVAVLGGGKALSARGGGRTGRRGARDSGEQPELVAPVTVAAGEATRSWRAAGNLTRIEPVTGSLPLRRGERVRIDVGPAAEDEGILGALAVDLAARTAEVRERLWFRARRPAARAADRRASA
jgi:hypothetical protein